MSGSVDERALVSHLLETVRWVAYFQAWAHGYRAGGGDRHATDLPQRAYIDYLAVKDTWAKGDV